MLYTLIPLTGTTGSIPLHLCDDLVGSGHEGLPIDNYFLGCRENRIGDNGFEIHRGADFQIVEILPLTLLS